MKKVMGIDVGCTLVKMAIHCADEEPVFVIEPVGNWRQDDSGLRKLVESIAVEGKVTVGLSGAGAARFAEIAKGKFNVVYDEPKNPPDLEIALQAVGLKRMLLNQGLLAEGVPFLMVSVGSGTSFSLVSEDDIRRYEPGLAVGGGYIAAQGTIVGVAPGDIGRLAAKGVDSDLLYGEVFRNAGALRSKFVIASGGKLGTEGCELTPENVCAAALKHVATSVAGHLMTIRNNPGWHWGGAVAFMGTPIDRYEPLRAHLEMMTPFLGLSGLFVRQSSFAGALGALMAASGEIDDKFLPPARLYGRVRARMTRYRTVTERLLKRPA